MKILIFFVIFFIAYLLGMFTMALFAMSKSTDQEIRLFDSEIENIRLKNRIKTLEDDAKYDKELGDLK